MNHCSGITWIHVAKSYPQLHQGLHILLVEVVRISSDVTSRTVDNPGGVMNIRIPNTNSFTCKGSAVRGELKLF
jgi:hypothetical protein